MESLFPLPKDRKLLYLFDYGDSWIFQISRTSKKPLSAESDADYPCLIDEIGERPEQYPQGGFTIYLGQAPTRRDWARILRRLG